MKGSSLAHGSKEKGRTEKRGFALGQTSHSLEPKRGESSGKSPMNTSSSPVGFRGSPPSPGKTGMSFEPGTAADAAKLRK